MTTVMVVVLAAVGVAASFHMTAVIWWVQLRVYPAFRTVPAAQWQGYHQRHTNRLGRIAGGPMILELAGAGAALGLLDAFPGRISGFVWVAFVLTIATWILTFALAVPLHRRLGNGKDVAAIESLIATNGWRTAAWTLKSSMVLGALVVWWATTNGATP